MAAVEKNILKIYNRRNTIFPHMQTVEHMSRTYELTIVKDGKISYFIDGEKYDIFPGQMLFINANVMHHRIYEHGEGRFDTIVVSPELLFPGMLESYYDRITSDQSPSFMLFSSGSSRHKEIIDLFAKLFEIYARRERGFEFEGMSQLYLASNKLVSYIEKVPSRRGVESINKAEEHKIYMKKMLEFIANNCHEKLSLAIIGESAGICRSRCCAYFKEYMNMSANDYLSQYRLAKSIEILENNDISLAQAAKMSGFNGASYYSELFKKVSGLTPTEWSGIAMPGRL